MATFTLERVPIGTFVVSRRDIVTASDEARAEATARERRFRPGTAPRRSLGELLAAAGSGARIVGSSDDVVSGVCLDSRAVQPGDLYAALPGANVHGAKFIAMAVANGASAVLTDEAGLAAAEEAGTSALVVQNPRHTLGYVSAAVYGTDAVRPDLFAVTGTNGKTTTTLMISAILEALNLRAGSIGTIGIAVGDDFIASTLTTPEAPQLHGLFARMVQAGVTHATMEVSSHSMVFDRVAGLHFRVGGFTNLTQDHLDLHNTMEEYFQAKAALFAPEYIDTGVVVVDDEWGKRLAHEAQAPVVTLATTADVRADWWVSDVTPVGGGHSFVLNGPDGVSVAATVGLAGLFNVANAALAMTMLIVGGIPAVQIADAVASAMKPLSRDVPGRMELVLEQPRVYVDFAHNPGGLESVLANVRMGADRVIVVFGAAGERDRLKRASMGEIAARYADVSIVTDDDTHFEDAAQIRAEVLAGVTDLPVGHEVLEVYPRAAAIAKAAELVGPNDVVVVAGRGHETAQDMGSELIELDDREEVRRAFAQ